MLSKTQIESYKSNGVLVVPEIFSSEEVKRIRNNMHQYMLDRHGIDHEKVLSGDKEMIEKLGEPRIKSPMRNTFYAGWKLLDVNCDNRIYEVFKEIFAATYAIQAEGFEHVFGNFDPSDLGVYIDRVCYRTPDHIREEGGLAPHLDRNPFDPYLQNIKGGLYRWRPIQALVTLVDHYGGESGGLRCVNGFHREIDNYFKEYQESELRAGEFYRLVSNKHTGLYKRCQPINAPAGSLILFDNRIVHSTCNKCISMDTREVIYGCFIPMVKLNQVYMSQQLQELVGNRRPPAYKIRANDEPDIGDRDFEIDSLSYFQKQILGFCIENQKKKHKK